MHALLLSFALMLLLIWSFKVLSNHFTPKMPPNSIVDNASTQNEAPSSIYIKLLTIGTLFLACFFFVNMVINKTSIKRQETILTIEEQKKLVQLMDSLQQQQKKELVPESKEKQIDIIASSNIKTRFNDVAGLIEVKDEIQDVIHFLQDPIKFTRLGAKAPKGVLLHGPPGTGKTLLARAIAGESNVAFVAVSGSQFDEEYVGVGASRVRKLFEAARKNAPCIIFIDEVDAIAYRRKAKDPAWSAQTINQLLSEMDGLDEKANEGIVVIGATNRMEVLDKAILRPGRLDRHIKIDLPTRSEREEILDIYLDKITASHKVTAKELAKTTPGFSAAELSNLVNEAAIIATKANKDMVEIEDFDAAKDRVIIGSKRSALKMSDTERRLTAYHEAGHALVGHLLNTEGKRNLYKVTIAPRGPSLGHTSFETSADDEFSTTRDGLESTITTQLAGRMAEELIFGSQKVTTGAENDLAKATYLAHSMVTKWGYSERVGLIHYTPELDFMPKDIIEAEVKKIINNSREHAKKLLITNKLKLDSLAKALLEQETLSAEEVDSILKAGI